MAQKKSTSTRTFKSDSQIMHDLYKLESAKMLKNISRDEVEPDYVKIEHCHFFHTVDSKGSKQDKCTPIGGHFHIMELVTPATDESPAIYKCSGPKKFVLDKQKRKQIVPSVDTDNHTHDITYLNSEVLKPAKINSEAMKVISSSEAKPQPVPGIVG